MTEAEALQRELDATQAAFAAEASRSLERLRQAETLQHAFEAEAARAIALQQDLQALDARLGEVSARFEAVTATRWWRIRETFAMAWHRLRPRPGDGDLH